MTGLIAPAQDVGYIITAKIPLGTRETIIMEMTFGWRQFSGIKDDVIQTTPCEAVLDSLRFRRFFIDLVCFDHRSDKRNGDVYLYMFVPPSSPLVVCLSPTNRPQLHVRLSHTDGGSVINSP